MALAGITQRTIRLYKGTGYVRYKAVDDLGEPLTSVGIVVKNKQVAMIAYSKDGWYSGDKSNPLRYTIDDKTLFMKRFAFRIIRRKER